MNQKEGTTLTMEASRKEQARIRKQRQRDKERQNSVTLGSVTPQNVTQEIKVVYKEGSQETVPASYVYGVNGKYQSLPERPRFLTLSDGQVLDRANQPGTKRNLGEPMLHSNEACYNFKPLEGG